MWKTRLGKERNDTNQETLSHVDQSTTSVNLSNQTVYGQQLDILKGAAPVVHFLS